MRVERTATGLTVEVESEAETDRVGRALAAVVGSGRVLGLIGPLGAGKTRLVRALAEALGVAPGAIASPTFVLIHEYEGALPVYHFDTYRLRGPDDFDALGAADYWDGDGVCLVEWADRVADRLPRDAWLVRIEPLGETRRRIDLQIPAADGAVDRLAEHLAAEPPG
jgi:tRNA threonylcarbamoyladenosine biosynthesis protein TsaE